ncbi:hypothetical protein Tsubulata_034005 [Turnera subulata]|uniref:Uncharacterized protein n=1 Tax=Turnera subulata TaxID=218843 RepID=A0A9Q0JGQ6_9ROSI|nr:hypothetical protein Tsubulata_034005 [Turnera subulata]
MAPSASTPSSSATPPATFSGGGGGGTPFPLLVPKLEPKTEPFDGFSALTPPVTTPQPPPPPQQQQLLQQQQQQTPSPSEPILAETPNFSNSTPGFYPILESTPHSQTDPFLAAEFARIRQLFDTAIGRRCGADLSLLHPPPDDNMEDMSRAIVPVPDTTATASSGSQTPTSSHLASRPSRKNNFPRSGELVRVTDMGIDDQIYFRDMVRRTRMVYDALRIVSVIEEEARQDEERMRRRARGDLLASRAMREGRMWLNRDKRIVGSIPGVEIGDVFFFRMELCVLGLHGQVQAGIDYLPASQSSNGEPIATSIIVSGGYEDDEDTGDVIIYTGHGGQDKLNRQCEHQKLEGGNLALERSMHHGIEVRVIRGIKYEGSLSQKLYVYDGLYKITDCWFDVGKSGFGVYKFKVVRMEGQQEMGTTTLKLAENLRKKPLLARPRGYHSLDISKQKENLPVFLFNDIDKECDPLFYQYLKSSVFPPFVINQGLNGTGCDCVGGCVDGCLCAMKNGGEFAYDQNGFLVRGKPVVFECGPFCKCPPTCRNRVSQMGLKKRLEIFRSRETGWGVRSLDLILAGAFICEYAGVILTRDQAQIFAMNGDRLIYPDRFTPRWAEWGDLSRLYPDYVQPSHPSLPPLDFAMDVSKMRNVACYMSHSTVPNVMVQFVLYDHNNLMFPHLMLFAMENIPPLRELSLDYGVADEGSGKLSICN